MPKALAKSDGYKTLVQKITREFAELEFFVKSRVAQGHGKLQKLPLTPVALHGIL